MKRSRLLKFKIIAPTNFSQKRISVKCSIYNDWKLFVWNTELDNSMKDQVIFILCNRFGFRLDEIMSYAEDKEDYFVMITNFGRRLIKEKNH